MSPIPGRAEQTVARGYRIAWLLVLLLAAFCRLATLGSEAVGSDELFSRGVAVQALPESMQTIRQDLVHPPLYYLLLKVMVCLFGAGLTAIRVLSLVSGVATIGILALLPRQWPEFWGPALLAAAILAVNHQHIVFSQQVRSYAFYAFLITLLLLWCLFLETRGDSNTWWALGSALMLIAIYTHYVSALYLGCIGLALLLGDAPPRRKRLTLLTLTGILLLFIPWIVYLSAAYQQRQGLDSNLGWITPPTLYQLKSVWAEFLGIPPFPAATTVSFCLGAVLVGAALLLPILHQEAKHRTMLLALGFTATVPPLALFVLSMTGKLPSFFGFRHLLPSIVPWCLLIGYGLRELCHRSRAAPRIQAGGWAVLIAFALVPSAVNRWNGPTKPRFDVMAAYLASSELSGLPAYTTWNGIREPVNFYAGGERVVLLNENAALPDRFVLLFRPTINSEQAAFEHLVANGYAVVKETKYGAVPDAYPALALLQRQPAPEPQ